jgi:hypothetical protein
VTFLARSNRWRLESTEILLVTCYFRSDNQILTECALHKPGIVRKMGGVPRQEMP